MVVVARVEVLVTKRLAERDREEAEAVVKLVWPFPQRIPEMDREVEEATPKIGVTKLGEVCWTVRPVPVVPLV
jgi:hypothetical protein